MDDSFVSKSTKKRSNSVELPKSSLFRFHAELDAQLRKQESSSSWKWKCEQKRVVLDLAFSKMGWKNVPFDEEKNWNISWFMDANLAEKCLLNSHLEQKQYVNHHLHSLALTRKDLMYKHWRDYLHLFSTVFDFVPMSFILPEDYEAFEKEYKEYPNKIWILKPSDRARGIGIQLIQSIEEIPKSLQEKDKSSSKTELMWSKNNFVISKYIDNPMLVNGKKFDLRIYVLVLSFQPLKAYIYEEGFARICVKEYTNDPLTLSDISVHLTNISVSAQTKSNSKEIETKWNLKKFRDYLEMNQNVDVLFRKIEYIIFHSLMACHQKIVDNNHSFSLFGYDILIDEKLQPWLLEVNGFPSLEPSDENDLQLKTNLIQDIATIVMNMEHNTHKCRQF